MLPESCQECKQIEPVRMPLLRAAPSRRVCTFRTVWIETIAESVLPSVVHIETQAVLAATLVSTSPVEICFIGRVGYWHSSDRKESVRGVTNASFVHRTRACGCKLACITSIHLRGESTISSLDSIGTTWLRRCLLCCGFR